MCYNENMRRVICPVCGNQLLTYDKSAYCENRHSYDRAREGYFYLLPPNAKKSVSPGDNKDMVEARKRFLATGSYLPLAHRLFELINARFKDDIALLDAGVGTGYYLSHIADSRGHRDDMIGVDISKDAVKVAARAVHDAFLAVASVYSLPVADGSADAVISVFSPFADKEFARVLSEGGALFAAVPAEEHLIELRRALYDDVRPVQSELRSDVLREAAREELSFKFELESSEDISALLSMTPYVYRAPLDRVTKVKNSNHMTFTADFLIYTFTK